MLITPRLYALHSSQRHDDLYNTYVLTNETNAATGEELDVRDVSEFPATIHRPAVRPSRNRNMLLLHQTGSVKVGEVVRYTLTYTPSLDRILPPPQHLHVKIKNTSAIPLRAAYLHGPYTLYAACYPSTFDPHVKHEREKEEGGPDYEPQLKAGGSWNSTLVVPEEVRASVEQRAKGGEGERKSFTWIIEIASQVLFSTTAAVHFELLVGRDEKSVSMGITGVVGHGEGVPAKLEDFQAKRTVLKAMVQTRGVFSKAVRLAIDDTETLWNTPPFPSWDDQGDVSVKQGPEHGGKRDTDAKRDERRRKRKKIHLVVLTHGLHSNLGADMLYMKESIDSASKQAAEDSKQRRAELRAQKAQQDNEFGREAAHLKSKSVPDITIAPTAASEDDDDDEEQVLVRGFNGNAVKTEKGIQYLGKRLAKYVLSITYPDQPYLPVKSSLSRSITRSFTGQKKSGGSGGMKSIHRTSSIVKDDEHTNHNLAYRITSISFIAHSLGGLVQTYAVAYIKKHSPEFFDRIEPVNFVALASPFLGLSNENPVYVKFALDFGLVGRTGQDLGLTWRAPNIARTGWGAMVNGLVNDPHKDHQPNPGSKPLLRILPTGPAHQALKLFRNRTVYSNVVNDGIVPLRTSCLLFLDWRGLDRVEKARRENGLIGTMVNWGWNEMTGQNATTAKKLLTWSDAFTDENDEADDVSRNSVDRGSMVPDARASQFLDDHQRPSISDSESLQKHRTTSVDDSYGAREDAKEQESNMWTGFLSWFRPQAGSKAVETGSTTSKSNRNPKRRKTPKIYRRGQTVFSDDSEPPSPDRPSSFDSRYSKPHGPVRGSSLYTNNSAEENLQAPPKTTVFESAGDLLNPPLPPQEFLMDPAARPRTIFHDRIYHPGDIPPPPSKRQKSFMRIPGSRSGSRNGSGDGGVPNPTNSDLSRISSSQPDPGSIGGMKIEEKIARAYHKDMAWRKVLVSMKPDAHNNMIVRRMFANAYGWPVVKHMCDTHFAFTVSAQTRDDEEDAEERAKPQSVAVGSTGEQVKGQVKPPDDETLKTSKSEERKAIPRSKSFDAGPARSDDDDEPRTSRQTIKSLSNQVRARDKKALVPGRSASEAREARDEVSDLVSVANVSAVGTNSGKFSTATYSGTAALHRLARQDSGRWSDRFFDGSENDSDEDEAYLEELKRARDRGEIATDDRGQVSKQPQPGRLLTDAPGIVAEPEAMTPISRKNTQQEDAEPRSLNLTGIGLGKTTSEQVLANQETVAQKVAHIAGQAPTGPSTKNI